MTFPDRLVPLKEISELTGKHPRTVRGWCANGDLRRVKFKGVVGVWESELLAALGWRGTPGTPRTTDDDPADHDNDDNDEG